MMSAASAWYVTQTSVPHPHSRRSLATPYATQHAANNGTQINFFLAEKTQKELTIQT
jgi:hypothetical protein